MSWVINMEHETTSPISHIWRTFSLVFLSVSYPTRRYKTISWGEIFIRVHSGKVTLGAVHRNGRFKSVCATSHFARLVHELCSAGTATDSEKSD